MKSLIVGGIIIALGIYLLLRSIKKEATDGCYACPSKGSCSSCSGNKKTHTNSKEQPK